jgi:hypothetical protein
MWRGELERRISRDFTRGREERNSRVIGAESREDPVVSTDLLY